MFIVPVGRGNWKKEALVIQTPDLLLMVREEQVTVGHRWFLANRWWRVVEVQA